MRRNYFRYYVAALLCALLSYGSARADAESKPDPRAQGLLTNFLQALQIEDEGRRVQACLPLLHKSLLTADGKDIIPDVKNFQFQKASRGAKWYLVPAKIARVRLKETRSFGDAPEDKGREDYYFITKKDGAAGQAVSPVGIFFPDNGAAPKILYMGNL